MPIDHYNIFIIHKGRQVVRRSTTHEGALEHLRDFPDWRHYSVVAVEGEPARPKILDRAIPREKWPDAIELPPGRRRDR